MDFRFKFKALSCLLCNCNSFLLGRILSRFDTYSNQYSDYNFPVHSLILMSYALITWTTTQGANLEDDIEIRADLEYNMTV